MYISGAGHAALIGWLLVGGLFQAPPPEEVTSTSVSLISSNDLAALNLPEAAPQVVDQAQQSPDAPDSDTAPQAPTPTTSPRPAPRPDRVAAPEAETPPAQPQQPLAPPPDPVIEDAPDQLTPPVETPGTDLAALPAPAPRPVDRVAPQAAPAPAPDAVIDEAARQATRPSPQALPDAAPETETTAPPEANDRIVTEADQGTVTSSPRPRPRPARRPTPPTTPPETAAETETADAAPTDPEPAAPDTDDAVRQALQGTGGAGIAPTGPPLTSGEKDALRLAVQSCWVVDAGSPAARVTVTLAFELSEQGKVQSGSLRMIENSGGADAALRAAFEAARRAILRCQRDGYDLPPEKYAQWREVEVVFDPSRLRN